MQFHDRKYVSHKYGEYDSLIKQFLYVIWYKI